MKNLSITVKIAIGLISALILIIVSNSITLRNIAKSQENASWVEHTHEVKSIIETLESDLKDAETGQRGFLISGMEDYLEPFNSAEDNIPVKFKTLKDLTSDNQEQQLRLDTLDLLIRDKFEELEYTIDLRRKDSFEAAKAVVLTDAGKQIMDDIRDVLRAMMEEENSLLEERSSATEAKQRSVMILTISLTLVVFVFVIILIVYYLRTISVPIRKLSSSAQMIAFGDLSENMVRKEGGDEITELSNSFYDMQMYLRAMAEKADQIAKGDLSGELKLKSEHDVLGHAFSVMVNKLNSQMEEIYKGITVLSTSTDEIKSVIANLSTSTSQTTTSISETTTTIEEIKQTAEISNQKAVEVSETGQKLSQISKEGNVAVQQTIDGMHKIKEQMDSIATIVIQLSEKSHAIGEIASTVNDLAEQSNLLAVNASIEAAKAGEQGKGFAVVAQEIKNLAERSKDSTIQIRTLLADIQKEIGGAVMATEQGGKVIEEGLKLSSTADEVISTLSSSTEEASQSNLIISSSSQQQLIGIDQINVAMESIRTASQDNLVSAKQTEQSVNELSDLGQRLINIINQYNLG